MNKREFLARLRAGLRGLPREDVEERVIFYSEMIDEGLEEGLSEAEAVGKLGPVGDVVAQILADMPPIDPVREKTGPRGRVRAWEIVLLILGFPVWFPLLLAAFAVVLAAVIVLWSLVVSLWAVDASLLGCALGGAVSAAAFLLRGNGLTAAVMLAAGLCCAGLAIFFFFGCRAFTKGALWLTKKTASGVKHLFIRKETA